MRDRSIGIGEASDEVKTWGFLKEPEIPLVPKLPEIDKSNRVKKIIEQFEKGDYDIITHTHKGTEDKKINRVKEKGIVIKVKRLETEEPGETVKEAHDSEPGLPISEPKKNKEKFMVKAKSIPEKKSENREKDNAFQYEEDIEPLI